MTTDNENAEDKTDDKQTAVADDKGGQTNDQPANTGAAQEDGLDELLKEFDARVEESSKREAEAKSEPDDKAADIGVTALATIEKELQDLQRREQRREIEKVFDKLAEGVEADAVDAEAFLNAVATRDPRVTKAYLQRAQSPKTWDKVFGALKQDFTKRFGKKVDKQVTESKDAVASAVRSASTAASQDDDNLSERDVSRMSKDEFDALQRKLGVSPV